WRHQQRRSLAGPARTARCGVAVERQYCRMLLCLQHAEARKTPLQLAPGFRLLRLLRAPAPQPSHRHDPAEGRNDAVLPVVDAGCVEDLQHRGPDVLVLHRIGTRGVDRKSTRLNSSHVSISYAVFCLKKKTN